MDDLDWEWLGRVPYREMLERQRLRRDAIVAGTARDVLWLLEHDPVVTTGRRGGLEPGFSGAEVVETERGGLATYHGPGQLVGYLLCDVVGRGGGVRSTVEALQAGVASWLAGRRVIAGPRAGFPGVWVGGAKICAIGLHFRRGVSMHGFALNLTVDLRGFDGFVPCGLAEARVTSLAQLEGAAPEPVDAAPGIAAEVIGALARSWR